MKEAEYTVEFSKVFINLASLLLGTSLLFVSQVTDKGPASLGLLIISWFCWTASVYLGAQSIGAISTLVGQAEIDEKDESTETFPSQFIADRLNATSLSNKLKWQMWLFLGGFACLILNALQQAVF